MNQLYRARLAPTPTGYLHLGHAHTFLIAQARAEAARGILVLRNDDLDRRRCKPEYISAMYEDLHWAGLTWQEGPDVGGPFAPYSQSERYDHYRRVLGSLVKAGRVYHCTCSRQDILRASHAPHADEDEPIYPGTCRHRVISSLPAQNQGAPFLNLRFRVPDGQRVAFMDGFFGAQTFVAGQDFGDFVLWRNDDVPAYQLATVADDAAMQITEVVRGEDLLRSTARQILLFQALNLSIPSFYHCPLVRDPQGVRLAKRHASLSLRTIRAQGRTVSAALEQHHSLSRAENGIPPRAGG